jgi:hypothetical protein
MGTAGGAPRRAVIKLFLPSCTGSTVVTMSQPHPHSAADLALAPVLISIERNLNQLRSTTDLEFALVLDLNDDDSWYSSAEERAQRVVKSATRDVDRHGWTVTPTPDYGGLAVSHGEYTVSVMLGARLTAEHLAHHQPLSAGRGHAVAAEGERSWGYGTFGRCLEEVPWAIFELGARQPAGRTGASPPQGGHDEG